MPADNEFLRWQAAEIYDYIEKMLDEGPDAAFRYAIYGEAEAETED